MGRVGYLLDDGLQRCEVMLDRPDMGDIHASDDLGHPVSATATDAVLLVFASRPYEADDYLRTYDEFLAELGEAQEMKISLS